MSNGKLQKRKGGASVARNKNETTVTFKVFNKEFKSGIKEMENSAKSLRQELKLEQEQLKMTGSESQKHASTLSNLEKQYDLAKQKTEATRKALSESKTLFGENSDAVKQMEKQLRSAEISEQQIANKIQLTSQKLEEAKSKESDRAQQLNKLKGSQETLVSSSEKLRKEYELQVAELGNNAKESDKAKVKQEYLAKAMQNSKEQVANLEEQLKLSKAQFGDNSTEVDKLEKELLEAKKASVEFTNEYAKATDKVGQFSEKAKNVGSSVSNIGKKWSMGVTAPIVAGVGFSVKAASDFESAFAGVKKTVDEATDANGKVTISYNDLEKGIRDMSKTLPASAAQISEVAENAGQLGIKTENVLSFTRTMIDLGESTNMSADEAATALARLANITGMPQTEFDKLGAVIVDLGNNFATTESEITEMGLRLAGAGHQVGMSEAQIMSFAAALSSVGIEAEAGGSAFSKVMVEMQLAVENGANAFSGLESLSQQTGVSMEQVSNAVRNGGKELKNTAGAMGLTSKELKTMHKEATDASGKLNDFAEVAGMSAEQFSKAFKEDASGAIIKFIEGLGKAEENGQSAIAVLDDMGITEVRLRDSLLRAAGASDVFKSAIDRGNNAWGENTALTEEASKRYETFESKVKILKNKVNDLAIEFGGPFMDALTDALDALQPVLNVLSDLAKSFSNASPEMKRFIMSIITIVAVLGPVLIIIGKIATAIGAIIGLFAEGGALAGVATWIGSTLLPALGTIVSAVVGWPLVIGAAIAAVAFLIYKYWDEIKEFFAGLGQWFHKFWDGLSQYFSETWENISKSSSEVWEKMTSSIQSTWNGIKMWFSETWDNISKGAQEGWKNITEGISNIWQSFTKKIADTLTNIGKWFSEKWQSIKEGAVNGWNNLVEAVSPIVEFLGRVIMVPISLVQATLEFIWGWIKVGAILAWEGIKKAAEVSWNFIKDKIISPIQEAYDWLVGKFTELGLWLSNKWTEFTTLATTFWESIKQAILTPIGAAYDWVMMKFSELGLWLGDKWNEILQIASNLWQGVKDNIFQPMSDAKDGVVNKAGEMWSGLTDWFGRTKDTAGEKWQGIKETMSDKFTSAKNGITETALNIWSSVSDTFGRVVSTVAEKFEAVKEFIMGPIRTAKDFVGQMVDEILGFFSRIKLPHFSVNFEDKKIFGKSVSVPKFNIDWRAKGGIFNTPTIFGENGGRLQGIGEAGREAALPLNKNTLGMIGQEIVQSLSHKDITAPLLEGLVEAARVKMSQSNQVNSSQRQMTEMMNQFMELLASNTGSGEVHQTVNVGSLNTNSMSEYDHFNRKMKTAAELANAGLRGVF